MGWRGLACVGLIVLASALVGLRASGQEGQARKQDEEAIRAAAKSYQAALAKGDAQALAACWTTDGEFIDAEGQAHPASELVAEAQQAAGEGPRSEVKTTASKIRFLTSDVAVEDGASEVTLPGGAAARGRFHATWVKQQGRWRLASLREMPDAATPPARVADLNWMVGTWAAETDGARLEATVKWNAAGTCLVRETKALRDGKVVLEGWQRIGPDPLSGELVSSSLDSEGGHTQAVWSREGDTWIEQGGGVMPDGRPIAATAVITFDGKDSYTRELTARIGHEPASAQTVRFTRAGNQQQ